MLVLAGSAAIVMTFLKEMLAPGEPLSKRILFGIMGGLVALAAPWISWYLEQRQREEEAGRGRRAQEDELKAMLRQWPPPLVTEVVPYGGETPAGCITTRDLGITPSERANSYAAPGRIPPYVPRLADKALDEKLRTKRLVLLVGHSKAGKSRTAFEAIRRMSPAPRLLIPVRGKALLTGEQAIRRLLNLQPPMDWGPEPAVLWLDELQDFLLSDGLGEALLNVLVRDERRITVVATMTLEQYGYFSGRSRRAGPRDEQSPSDQLGLEASARAVLSRFEEGKVVLEPGLTEREARDAQVLYWKEPEQALRCGLGEYLIAAEELRDRFFELGTCEARAGHALVRAAIDWFRGGLRRAIPEPELQKLAGRYLRELRVDERLTEEVYALGLKWAMEPVSSRIALLTLSEQAGARCFEPFDYMVDLLWRQELPIAEEVWPLLLAHASPEELLGVGESAYRRNLLPIAERAFRRARDSGHPGVVPQATVKLGRVLAAHGDDEGARAAWLQALDSHHVDAAPWAALHLGTLLARREDFEGARAAFQQAIDSHHADVAPKAAFNLGVLLARREDFEGARAAWLQAIDSHHADVTPRAANNLGFLLERRGDFEGARAAFQQAIDSHHEDVAPQAAFKLGLLLKRRGELEGARAAYQWAIDSQHEDVAPQAANNLGTLLEDRGDLEGARAAYQRAIDSHHADAAPRAAFNLGNLLFIKYRDYEGARAAYLQAIRFRHEEIAPKAWLALEEVFRKQGADGSDIAAVFHEVYDTW
jgi:tetratricopeptide (TPR) repeat protein